VSALPSAARGQPELGARSAAARRRVRSEQVLALPESPRFCTRFGMSSSFFLSLCFFTVSVEKVELKGLAHKKNERNIEYSFEVSFGDRGFLY